MTRVLLAFDKFKDSLTAQAACEITAAALKTVQPEWRVTHAPLADGGEGFAGILTRSAGGRMLTEQVTGPRGEALQAEFGMVPLRAIPEPARQQLQVASDVPSDAEVAVIEMACASGLALLPAAARDPWLTTSRGTGELMRAAVRRGATGILLGVGGSATNDLGLGALSALGFEFISSEGGVLELPIPACWKSIVRVVAPPRVGLPPVRIACDVTNPLLGMRGAAAVYGPQKGLKIEELPALEAESKRLGELLCSAVEKSPELMAVPGAGAAGGIAFGLMAGVDARLLPGFELVSAWLDLESELKAADLVITGEGRFDDSSLEGKGPGAVAARALELGKRVHVFAGQITAAGRSSLDLHAITPPGTPMAAALRNAPRNLDAAVRRIFSVTDV